MRGDGGYVRIAETSYSTIKRKKLGATTHLAAKYILTIHEFMAKAIYTLVFSAISLAHILHGIIIHSPSVTLHVRRFILTGEQLVFPEGEVHSILCTAPDENHFEINWGTGDGGFFENEGTFTVGDEEPATNGTKGRKVMFTVLPEVNGITLKCVVINFDQPSDSPEPLEFTIIIQGLLINLL